MRYYAQHFIDYFKEERKLEEMDWYDFKEYNKLRPVIIFRFENSEKKDLEKIRDEIRKYYNKEEVIIVLVGYYKKEQLSDDYGVW